MERIQVRFEQRRGLCAAVEGNPPYRREEMDDFMLRMLQEYSIPGFLQPDAEEIDGCLTLRYPLSGTRMLAQAMRSDKWSMTELMTALCRLAELMEDCRLYALSHDCLLLREDLMFVGDGWHDLRLVYLPVTGERVQPQGALSDLIVRWMLEVSNLDGRVLQEVLRIAGSPGFKPAVLRQCARQYLAEHSRVDRVLPSPEAGGGPISPGSRPVPPEAFRKETDHPQPNPAAAWRWFQPAAGDRHSLSGMLGDEPVLSGSAGSQPDEEGPPQSTDRRIWLVCGAVAASSAAWRFGYMDHRAAGGLWFSLGVTLAALAALFRFWRPSFRPFQPKRFSPQVQAPLVPDIDEKQHIHLEDPHFIPSDFPSPVHETGSFPGGTDRTQQLNPGGQKKDPDYYLVWVSPAQPVNIALVEASVVIGRSREAARHVDETHGVSRAHAELLRIADGWAVKDLGSRNGTKINDRPMVPYEPYALQVGDCLDLAGSLYRFHHGFLAGGTG